MSYEIFNKLLLVNKPLFLKSVFLYSMSINQEEENVDEYQKAKKQTRGNIIKFNNAP